MVKTLVTQFPSWLLKRPHYMNFNLNFEFLLTLKKIKGHRGGLWFTRSRPGDKNVVSSQMLLHLSLIRRQFGRFRLVHFKRYFKPFKHGHPTSQMQTHIFTFPGLTLIIGKRKPKRSSRPLWVGLQARHLCLSYGSVTLLRPFDCHLELRT